MPRNQITREREQKFRSVVPENGRLMKLKDSLSLQWQRRSLLQQSEELNGFQFWRQYNSRTPIGRRMLTRSFVSSYVKSYKRFSSSATTILKPGDVLRKARIYSDLDIIEYSKVSRDSNLLHFDSEFARNAGFEDRLVHGMLVAALFPRIISSHFPGAVYVSQSLHFKFPVYIGDEVIGEVQAINIRENKKRFIAKFSTKCFKNGDQLVVDGEAMTILPTLAIEQVQSIE